MKAFNPTHKLVSRSKEVPVALIPGPDGYLVMTEVEWKERRKPAFSIHPKLGLFCLGVAVVGYDIRPLESESRTRAQKGNGCSLHLSAKGAIPCIPETRHNQPILV